MSKTEILSRVRELGLLAVIRGPSPELAVKMVDALVSGGVLGIEITYTTPKAPQVVETLKMKYGDQILLGMGTLTKPEQAIEAQAAGAQFLVSPHTEPGLAGAMTDTGLSLMMGALTPSEVVQSYTLGSDIVKLFPGSPGGPAYMKALCGPFSDIPMMPTGGVRADNLSDWFAAGAVAVGAGSALCPGDWAKGGRFDDISERAAAFIQAVAEARSLDS